MITKKTNQLKKVSYFCLTLLSTAFLSSTEAIETPSTDYRERYRGVHNSMVEKYSKENPDLLRHKLPIESKVKGPSLTKETGNFLEETRKLKERFKKENDDLGKVGETVSKGAAYLTKEIIGNKVTDPEAKSFLSGLVDSVKEKTLSFFKQ